MPWLNYLSPLNDPNLRRLFGDGDGTGTVDGVDFAAFGTLFGQTLPDSPFDFDADGAIDANDFAAFGGRFGLTI